VEGGKKKKREKNQGSRRSRSTFGVRKGERRRKKKKTPFPPPPLSALVVLDLRKGGGGDLSLLFFLSVINRVRPTLEDPGSVTQGEEERGEEKSWKPRIEKEEGKKKKKGKKGDFRGYHSCTPVSIASLRPSGGGIRKKKAGKRDLPLFYEHNPAARTPGEKGEKEKGEGGKKRALRFNP